MPDHSFPRSSRTAHPLCRKHSCTVPDDRFAAADYSSKQACREPLICRTSPGEHQGHAGQRAAGGYGSLFSEQAGDPGMSQIPS